MKMIAENKLCEMFAITNIKHKINDIFLIEMRVEKHKTK